MIIIIFIICILMIIIIFIICILMIIIIFIIIILNNLKINTELFIIHSTNNINLIITKKYSLNQFNPAT